MSDKASDRDKVKTESTGDDKRRELPKGYAFYNVTWSAEARRPGELVRSPGLLSGLQDKHPFFEDPLVFQPGETRALPLGKQGARDLADHKHLTVELRGDGSAQDDVEQELVELVAERDRGIRTARRQVDSFQDGGGEVAQVTLVRSLYSLGCVKEEHIDVLENFEILSSDECRRLRTISANVRKLTAKLEDRGYKFHKDGRVTEPSTGGRSAHFPARFINAAHDLAMAQGELYAAGPELKDYIQRLLSPTAGETPDDQIAERIKALKRQRKQAAKKAKPPP